MRMRKKIGSLVLVAALVLTLLTPMALADGTVLKVSTPATIPKAGEEFTVTVEITGNPGFCAVQFTLGYDKDAMTCTAVVEGALLSNMMSVTNPNASDGAIVAAASTTSADGDDVMARFRFVAKRDLSSFDFKLSDVLLSDKSGEDIPFTVTGAELVKPEPAPTTTTPPATTQGATTPAGQSKPVEQTTGGAESAAAFPDTAGHWAADWIAKAAERGLFGGDDKGNFRPDDKITRGDYMLVIWRMAGKPEPTGASPFADVAENAYYAKAVAWAYEKGIVNGKGDGFAPRDSLTRQEAMKILFGYAGSPTGTEAMFGGVYDSTFTDSGEIASWAKSAMYWAYYHEIINGTGADTLGPTATATRAQLAKILVGYMDKQ